MKKTKNNNLENTEGILYVVATPIGNLEDITLRAIRVLKEVDIVLCEDTRTTEKLFRAHDINTKTASYHSHTTKAKHEWIITLLQEGKKIALVSDAGTPGISDPGVLLISMLLKEAPGLKIVPIPGASALTGAISVAGIETSEFHFMGFIPQKKGRQTAIKKIIASKETVIFFESTHRIKKALVELDKEGLPPLKHIVLFRELTKMFETTYRGSPKEVLAMISKDVNQVKGEFVVLVGRHLL